MCSQTKAAALMANIPQAEIDPTGVFKYVLIRVHSKEEGDDSEMDIVRGYSWAEYHGKSVTYVILKCFRQQKKSLNHPPNPT